VTLKEKKVSPAPFPKKEKVSVRAARRNNGL